MKKLVRHIISFALVLLASWIVFMVTYEIVEYINPSKRYNENDDPEFVMPIRALVLGLITSLIALIPVTIWTNKILKNKFITK